MNGTTLLEEFSKLDESEQIQVVEDMWDQIAERKGLPPITSDQQNELRRRKAAHSGEAPAGSSWEDAKQRILNTDV